MTHHTLLSGSKRLALVIAISLPMMSCFHLNKFASEATDFNSQVAIAQDQTLLLNVMRAANRFPMHFTELSTLSGTATLTAGGTLTAPFATLNGGMGTFSLAPTATITETPTFNMAVLETQEFYRGMLTPVSQEQIGTYYEEGLQPELVWTLMFGQLAFQSEPTEKLQIIENNFHPLKEENKETFVKDKQGQLVKDKQGQFVKKPGCPASDVSEYDCFRDVVRALVDRHLATEQVSETSNLGPAIYDHAFTDLKWLSGYDPKAVKFTAISKEDCKTKKDAAPDWKDACAELVKGLPEEQKKAFDEGVTLYRLQRESTKTRFCFDDALGSGQDNPDRTDVTTIIKTIKISYKLLCKSRLPKDYKPVKDKQPHGQTLLFNFGGGNAMSEDESGPSIEVRPRSTEGIIYYLGEITRCSLIVKNSPCPEKVKIIDLSHPADPAHPENNENVLFEIQDIANSATSKVEDPKDPQPIMTIRFDWNKKDYQVKMDPSGHDRSGQVLRVLTQLLALNRSAKDFPTPSIVPIISH